MHLIAIITTDLTAPALITMSRRDADALMWHAIQAARTSTAQPLLAWLREVQTRCNLVAWATLRELRAIAANLKLRSDGTRTDILARIIAWRDEHSRRLTTLPSDA